jgi:hypothetical protein
MSMTEDEIKALETEVSDEGTDSAKDSAPSGDFGGLSAAFDNAFANVEWQPGETK